MATFFEKLRYRLSIWKWNFLWGGALRNFRWYGFCPECNSDAPEMDTCKVCGSGTVPRQFIERNYKKKHKHPDYATTSQERTVRKPSDHTTNGRAVS